MLYFALQRGSDSSFLKFKKFIDVGSGAAGPDLDGILILSGSGKLSSRLVLNFC